MRIFREVHELLRVDREESMSDLLREDVPARARVERAAHCEGQLGAPRAAHGVLGGVAETDAIQSQLFRLH